MSSNKRSRSKDNDLPDIGTEHKGDFSVYMGHKIKKLDEENKKGLKESDIISNIFQNCYVFVNGETTPPIQELKRLVYINGGIFNGYQTHSTTHIICERLTDAQIKNMSEKKRIIKESDNKYVRPLWILDSIEKGKKQPESLYPPDGLILHGNNLNLLFSKKNEEKISNNNNNNYRNNNNTTYMKDNDGNNIENEILINNNNNTNRNHLSTNSNSSTIKAPALNSEENPLFMEQYFQNSRLHFIGTWRNRLDQLLKKFPRQLQNSPIKQKNNQRLRLVFHIDLDCFFVNVLLRKERNLHSKPVAVAHSHKAGSSEVSSCNYPARKYGIKNGMFMHDAIRLCPDLIVKPYDFKAYEEVGLKFYEILFTSDALVTEAVSVDEAYLEYDIGINGLEKAEYIRNRIYNETGGCTASVGIANNKLLARLATKKAKPNGKYQVQENEEEIKTFLSNLSIEELPGVGWKNSQKLKEKGLIVCGDIVKHSKQTLINWFGDNMGLMLYETARGIDTRELDAVKPRNSLGAEVNWGLRFTDFNKATNFLHRLANEVARRLEEIQKKGVTITMKIKIARVGERVPSKFMGHGICDDMSKSSTLKKYIHSGDEIAEVSLPLFKEMMQGKDILDLRGMGIQVSRLEDRFLERSSAMGTWLAPQKQMEMSSTKDVADDVSINARKTLASSSSSSSSSSTTATTAEKATTTLSSSSSSINIINDDLSFISSSQEMFLKNIPQHLRGEVITQLQAINDLKQKTSTSSKVNSKQQVVQHKSHQTKITHLFKAEELKQNCTLDAEEWHQLLKTIEEQAAIATLGNKKLLVNKANDNKSSNSTIMNNNNNAIDESKCDIKKYEFLRENMILVGRSLMDWISKCSEPTEDRLLLMQKYGAWLIQSYQLDQAVLFIKTLDFAVKSVAPCNTKWREVVERTISSMQEESQKIFNAKFIIE